MRTILVNDDANFMLGIDHFHAANLKFIYVFLTNELSSYIVLHIRKRWLIKQDYEIITISVWYSCTI